MSEGGAGAEGAGSEGARSAGAGPGAARPGRDTPRPPDGRAVLRLLWDHAGRIAAFFLGAVFLLALLFLAVIGSTPALVLLVVVVVGVAMIALGGRIRA
jgi:hypothetical protein